MKDHIDLAIFQCLNLFCLGIKTDHIKLQRLIGKAVCGKLDIIAQYANHLAIFGVQSADTIIVIQPADPDRSVL